MLFILKYCTPRESALDTLVSQIGRLQHEIVRSRNRISNYLYWIKEDEYDHLNRQERIYGTYCSFSKTYGNVGLLDEEIVELKEAEATRLRKRDELSEERIALNALITKRRNYENAYVAIGGRPTSISS